MLLRVWIAIVFVVGCSSEAEEACASYCDSSLANGACDIVGICNRPGDCDCVDSCAIDGHHTEHALGTFCQLPLRAWNDCVAASRMACSAETVDQCGPEADNLGRCFASRPH